MGGGGGGAWGRVGGGGGQVDGCELRSEAFVKKGGGSGLGGGGFGLWGSGWMCMEK